MENFFLIPIFQLVSRLHCRIYGFKIERICSEIHQLWENTSFLKMTALSCCQALVVHLIFRISTANWRTLCQVSTSHPHFFIVRYFGCHCYALSSLMHALPLHGSATANWLCHPWHCSCMSWSFFIIIKFQHPCLS